MKKERTIAFLVSLLPVFSISAFAHGLSRDDLTELSQAYGYVYSQQMCAEQIREAYPSLAYDYLRFCNAWENRYPKAKKALAKHLGCFGLNENFLLKSMRNNPEWQENEKNIRTILMDENKARDQLRFFTFRIDNPNEFDRKIFSTLGDVVYQKNPALEFGKDRIKYSTLGSPRALGVDINIEIPASWKEKEPIRPHIVKKWDKSDEKNYLVTMILVGDYSEGDLWTDENLNDFVESGDAWSLFPITSSLTEKEDAFVTKIEGLPALMLSGQGTFERAGVRSKVYFSTVTFAFRDKLISVQIGIYSKDREELDKQIRKNKSLINMIFNSLYLPQLWE